MLVFVTVRDQRVENSLEDFVSGMVRWNVCLRFSHWERRIDHQPMDSLSHDNRLVLHYQIGPKPEAHHSVGIQAPSTACRAGDRIEPLCFNVSLTGPHPTQLDFLFLKQLVNVLDDCFRLTGNRVDDGLREWTKGWTHASCATRSARNQESDR
jgi:hypothetical protein